MSREFSKEKIKVVRKYLSECSTLLVLRSYHMTSRMDKIKKTFVNKF